MEDLKLPKKIYRLLLKVLKNIFQKIETLFKDMPRRSLPDRPAPAALPAKAKKELFKMDRSETLLVLGFKTISIKDPDRSALEVLDTILSGMSGRLFSAIRDKSALAYTLGCAQKLGVDTGFILFYVATTKEDLPMVKEKLYGQIKLIKETSVTDDELESAKKEMLSGYRLLMQTNASYSFQSALDELYGLGYENLYKYEERIKRVTKEDVKKVAEKYLDLNASTEVVIGPE